MRPLLKRIAIHGALAALVLALMGLMFAELASIWLASTPSARPVPGGPIAANDAKDPVVASLRTRVPVLMALWGFGFVAVGETLLHLWRGSPRPAATLQPPPPDSVEKLLEELLTQAEAKNANLEATVAPMAATNDNTPTSTPGRTATGSVEPTP